MPMETASALATGKCAVSKQGIEVSTYIQSATNVVTDCVLVVLPIRSVLGTIMDKKTRFSIIGILILGAA
jgi:hypothetical protein